MSSVLQASAERRIALIGAPNCGKTTLFNALTGLRAKVANYPGVTVERREGLVRGVDSALRLLDLPGTYSLDAVSEDEHVSVELLRGQLEGTPDAVVVVVDATTLDRSLPLLAEVLELGLPTLLALTMVDELKRRGGEIDPHVLRAKIGIPVVGVVGNRGLGLDDLRAQLEKPEEWTRAEVPQLERAEDRFAWSDAVLSQTRRTLPQPSAATRRLDAFLLHPILGPLAFLVFVTLFFQSIFTWASPAMDLLDGGISACADWLSAKLPSGWFSDLLADGIVRGVGAVVVFIPQIALLFALIFFLEACGYMARASFVVDRLMGWVGLEGRCFIALLSSYACAVPGIMATRSIPSRQDRLATILVAPFATCSARLPVYTLLIAAFIPADPVLGPLTLQGVTMLGLYFLGGISALVFAALFKRGFLRGRALPFYQELPPYRWPSLRNVAMQVWIRIRLFLRKAGTVILVASILLWALLNFPQHSPAAGTSPQEAQRQQIEQSYAADIGRAVEPVFDPLGFDWRVNVALIGSFAAREVMVSTLAQVYGRGEADEEDTGLVASVRESMTLASALALLAFFVYALQCISTIAVIRRETNGWLWPTFCLGYMSGVAWLAAWLTYLIASS